MPCHGVVRYPTSASIPCLQFDPCHYDNRCNATSSPAITFYRMDGEACRAARDDGNQRSEELGDLRRRQGQKPYPRPPIGVSAFQVDSRRKAAPRRPWPLLSEQYERRYLSGFRVLPCRTCPSGGQSLVDRQFASARSSHTRHVIGRPAGKVGVHERPVPANRQAPRGGCDAVDHKGREGQAFTHPRHAVIRG